MGSKRRKRVRRGGFRPPFCPNPECLFHRRPEGWRYLRDGFYLRPSDGKRFQAFECAACGRNFSSRTFSTTYWLKRRDLLRPCAAWICEGPALRQIARVMKTTHGTIARMVSRVGRHCLLFHQRLLDQAGKKGVLREPLVIDGFESFEYSQFFPFHANLAAGARSCLLYHFNDAPLRRKGSMTADQKRKRRALEESLGRPDPKAIQKAVAALLRQSIALLAKGKVLVLHSDEHPAYRRALREVRRERGCPRILHIQTSSRERRTRSNPLFPVNLADLRIRHGQANHRRETIAFSKRRQRAMERQAVFTVWANCIKKKSEKKGETTSAMEVGLLGRPLTWEGILKRRLFPAQIRMCREWRAYYAGRVKTLALGAQQTEHLLKYAV